MRLLSTVHGFPPKQIGGTEVNVYHVSKLVKKKCDLLVFARDFDPSRQDYEEYVETVDGIRVYRINLNVSTRPFSDTYSDPRIANAFERVVSGFRPDVVHFCHVIELSTEMLRIAKEHGIPVVLTLRDFFFACHRIFLIDIKQRLCSGPEDGSKCANCIRPDALSDIERWKTEHKPELNGEDELLRHLGRERLNYMVTALRIPDLILCPSEFTKSRFVEFGIPAEKIRISPTGIDKSFLSKTRPPGGDRIIRFGFIGGISYHKGLHTLIEAFTSLPQESASLEVYGWGNSEYSNDLKKKSSDYNVHFHGLYHLERMGEAFSNFDVLVVPTTAHENYSLVIREALAAGRPVIVSNLRSQMDFVRDGIDGFRFQAEDASDLYDKMLRFVSDPSLIMRLGGNHLPIRDVADQASELLQIYGSLTASRQTSSRDSESEIRQHMREKQVDDLWGWQWTLQKALEQQRTENRRLTNELARRDNELAQRDNELATIHSSLGYRFMRFYASKIDRLFPVGTKRGALRQRVTNRIAGQTKETSHGR